MSLKGHPIPKVGDTVVLNSGGLNQIYGTDIGLGHMKTLRMKITSVSSISTTTPEQSFVVSVDNQEIDSFMIDHWMFDVVVEADSAACRILNDRKCSCGFGQCRQGQIF